MLQIVYIYNVNHATVYCAKFENTIFLLLIENKLIICCLGKDLKRKIRTWIGIRTSYLWITSPALYHLSYSGSHASSCSNLPLATDDTWTRGCVLDTMCHLLTTSELTSPFKWIWYSNQIIYWKHTYNLLHWEIYFIRSLSVLRLPIEICCPH